MKKDADPDSPWILVTNDDGADSPALVPLLRQLEAIAPVRALVPARERSWASKTMTRFGRLELRRFEREGGAIWAVDGYPADCANLGIHTLFSSRPSLVVSGVNIGTNAGLAYFLSSGTVGAAIESALGGVPALAVSAELTAEDYTRWRQHRELEALAPQWENAARIAGELAAEVWQNGLPGGAALLTVNLPATATPQTPRRFAPLTSTSYGAFFARGEAADFSYCLSGLRVNCPDARGDLAVLERGEVTLTPIRLALDAEPADADRRRFERP